MIYSFPIWLKYSNTLILNTPNGKLSKIVGWLLRLMDWGRDVSSLYSKARTRMLFYYICMWCPLSWFPSDTNMHVSTIPWSWSPTKTMQKVHKGAIQNTTHRVSIPLCMLNHDFDVHACSTWLRGYISVGRASLLQLHR